MEKWSKNKNCKSHLIFIIQRHDVDYFRVYAERDCIYSRAVWNSLKNIDIRAYKIKWDPKKGCHGWKRLPILWWVNN